MTLLRPRLDDAACRGQEDLFLGRASEENVNRMRTVCGSCRDRPECFAYALGHEDFGFWAGHTAAERRRLRTKYGIEIDRITNGNYTQAAYTTHEGDDDEHEDGVATADRA